MLCRGTNPEKAGRAFADDDEDAVPRSEGKDKVESVSLEDMMGNALQAARCRAVKQCVLKAAARRRVAKKAKGDLPGVALAAPAELATAVAGSTAGVGGAGWQASSEHLTWQLSASV